MNNNPIRHTYLVAWGEGYEEGFNDAMKLVRDAIADLGLPLSEISPDYKCWSINDVLRAVDGIVERA